MSLVLFCAVLWLAGEQCRTNTTDKDLAFPPSHSAEETRARDASLRGALEFVRLSLPTSYPLTFLLTDHLYAALQGIRVELGVDHGRITPIFDSSL